MEKCLSVFANAEPLCASSQLAVLTSSYPCLEQATQKLSPPMGALFGLTRVLICSGTALSF